ncbi:hypothetical protein CK203_039044 [Vitis vinifera]|uniref:Uncharacterized protein n=1 Tax=Vitis vinifera TaxID=29760 RepID=A0A438HLR0_VITVI|nr:hypothetical protein CK203_039044 [Vitis vinifera]
MRMEPKLLVGKHSNKRARSATRRGIGGKTKNDVTISDDVKELDTKVELGRKVAVGGGKSKGERSASKKGKLGGGDEVLKGGGKIPSEENFKTPMKRKRGADGEIVQAFLSSTERSSSRLRPRKDVPTFRKVELAENDSERIVGKRVKIYWSGSRRWFVGRVKAFDHDKRCHRQFTMKMVRKEDLDLRQERKEETKEEANLTESVEVDVEHDEVKTDTLHSEIITEKICGAQATKPNFNSEKGKSCLDDGKISGEADNMVDLAMDVEVSVHPEEVGEKVIRGETNVSQSKEVSGSAGDMPKDESNDDAEIPKPQPTENDPKFKESSFWSLRNQNFVLGQ